MKSFFLRQSVPDKLSQKDVATLLLHLHGQVFGAESVTKIAETCEITFASEADLTRATWEWFYFGLHAVVQGVQNNFSGKPDVGKAIVRALFSELHSHLVAVGFTAPELEGKLASIKERFTQFDAICATGEYERVGQGAAALVLDLKIAPGKIPRTLEAYEFGLLANQSYIGTLKATSELFASIKLSSG